MIEGLAHKAHKRGVTLWITGASRDIRRTLLTHGLRRPLCRYASDCAFRAHPITDSDLIRSAIPI
jgi:SulP family sulfate permease